MKKVMKYFFLTLFFICNLLILNEVEGLFAYPPVVSNVSFKQVGDTIEVYYDLSDQDSDQFTVNLFGSTNGGKTYNVTPKTVEGDVGKNVNSGKKKIIWMVENDVVAGFVPVLKSDNFVVKVIADNGIVAKPSEILGKDSAPMVLIPAGEFMMGAPANEGNEDEHPQHKVYLDAYYIDKYEVTNEQYAKFLNDYGKDTDDNGNKMIYKHMWGVIKTNNEWIAESNYSKYPVVNVTWYGANQYAKYYGKRLPTEAEWEKACRADNTTKYCFGNNDSELDNYAWCQPKHGGNTHPVGLKEPNVWNIYDMHGNVWEWCVDWYDDYYKNSSLIDPKGPDNGSHRVVRGGSWGDNYYYCRSAARFGDNPANGSCNTGFRCIQSQ